MLTPDFWISGAALVAVLALAVSASGYHNHAIEHLDRQVRHLEGFIMSQQQDTVNALVDQLRKSQTEIVAQLARAQAQIDAAGVADQVDLSTLVSAVQAIDDIVPDAPADPPVDAGTAADA